MCPKVMDRWPGSSRFLRLNLLGNGFLYREFHSGLKLCQLTSWKLPALMFCGSWKNFKSQKGSYLKMIFLRCHLDEDKIHLFPWLSGNDRKASEHSLIITWCSELEFH